MTHPPPQTREDFLRCKIDFNIYSIVVFHRSPPNACSTNIPSLYLLTTDAANLTFDTNTAHKKLRLSDEDRKVTASNMCVDYPEHKDRFDSRAQILCSEALRGSPQYWEVEYDSGYWVCIAVSYKGIGRKGKRGPLFGRNRRSWGLRCDVLSFNYWHNNKETLVKKNTSRCCKIGVYLDHSAGILAFYDVLDNMSLIYMAQTVFSEPVYPGFGLAGYGSYVRLCDLMKSETVTSPFSGFCV